MGRRAGLFPAIQRSCGGLFGWTPASDEHAERLKLSGALNRLNARHGRDTVPIGAAVRLPRHTGTKVAFPTGPSSANEATLP